MLTTLAALAFAAFTIGHVLERFVVHNLDTQLDTQISVLVRAVRPDGTLDTARVVNLPLFDNAGSGWGWRVDGSGGDSWSHGAAIDLVRLEKRQAHRDHHRHMPYGEDAAEDVRGDARTVLDKDTQVRQMSFAVAQGLVTVTASGPRHEAMALLHQAVVPLMGSLALLAGGLAFATFMQLRFGLQPLRSLRRALADVRTGRARHVPLDQPDELVPLAIELNALIDQNEAGLEHARRHVSNLAHGLKTPLAALSVRLADSGYDRDGSLGEMLSQVDRRIRHHLGRARAAAPGGAQRTRTAIAPAIADLVSALKRIHAERAIGVTVEIAVNLAVAVDAQDFDEMAGNLLDNAWRHASSAVAITAVRHDATVVLLIDDDGSGLSEEAMREAFVPGRRLDERGDGHGFGLPITQELAELNGGELTLHVSPAMSGLRARLVLPAGL
ncbi:sensor histidine kinase [Novosphingobium terrae]|uniref:sensor histidine kinase n=1 Tax=Novosphingobium terrae TaxID=2726189 RepID=UPI001F136A4F|nr:HAMP domain-containing sensor histidine kinase [Novosphingobium terrae]